MLFNEPKLLKPSTPRVTTSLRRDFSALQRAEIAETDRPEPAKNAEIDFSALQRAEIAERSGHSVSYNPVGRISVLFNEPKLLKLERRGAEPADGEISVLFNEPKLLKLPQTLLLQRHSASFQCSSTSRNC